MCGKQFHMLEKLLTVLQRRTPKISSLPPIQPTTKVFMYAKEWCRRSREARRILVEDLDMNPDNICILDVEESKLICASKWMWLDNEKQTKEVNDARIKTMMKWQVFYCNPSKNLTATVPQIFFHFHPYWYYVGGCSELESIPKNVASASTTVANTQESDLLHLLPSVTEGRRNQPTQLKF